jgi:hypothetical protein
MKLFLMGKLFSGIFHHLMDYFDYILGVFLLFSQIFDFSEKHLDELLSLNIIKCSLEDIAPAQHRKHVQFYEKSQAARSTKVQDYTSFGCYFKDSIEN